MQQLPPFPLPSLLTHSSGSTPGGDSYHFPINFLFLLSLRPPFLSALSLPAAQLGFCAMFEEIQSWIFSPIF